MLYGVGTDIISIDRVLKACEKDAFCTKVFTDEERREAADVKKRLAGDFAVKEAVSKAFGTGFGSIRPSDIEVLRDERGRPYVKLYNKAMQYAKDNGIVRISVSISDSEGIVLAFAAAETDGGISPHRI